MSQMLSFLPTKIYSSKMAKMQHFLAKAALLLLATISHFHLMITFSKASKPTGFSLKLIPGDSPKSPLYPGNLTAHERMQWLINISQARMIHHSQSIKTSIWSPDNIRSTIIRDHFYFAVHVTIGNPGWGVYLLMDTGGGLIWTQCQPCIKCFDSQYGIFDPRISTTYSKLPCDHPLSQGFCKCVDGDDQCVYDVSYPGSSGRVRGRTKGVASFESFTFLTTEGAPVSIDKIVFGCSNDNENFERHMGESHNIGGMMGMSLSQDSLVSQLGDRIQRKFSYCLPPLEDKLENNILLNFGSDVPVPSSNLQTTPFVTPEGVHRFYLNLKDLSVGSHRMGFPPGTFRVNGDGSEGFLIDSGSPLTYLDSDAYGTDVYSEVLGVFQIHYDSHGLTREMDMKPHGFELCYENRPRFDDFLTMTYHFEPDAEYVVHSKDVHFFDNQRGIFCVALLGEGSQTVLGAWHQQNKRLIYDLGLGQLQFATETCPH